MASQRTSLASDSPFVADLLIPSTCNERFLVTPTRGATVFQEAQLDFAGMSQLVPPYRAQRWNCWHHIVLFTMAGEGVVEAQGKSHVLAPGTVCLLPAGLDHCYYTRTSWTLTWFHPKPTAYWNALIGSQVCIRPFGYGERLAVLGEYLWSELISADPDSRAATPILSQALLHYLQRELKQNETMTHKLWRLRLEPIWAHVYSEPARWSVQQIANKVHCSRTHLHSICQALYGQTAQAKLNALRVQRAAEYVCYTSWTLQEIAERVGYADAFSFSKAFRRRMKVSPASYRTAKSLGTARSGI